MRTAFVPLLLALSGGCAFTAVVAQEPPPITLRVERFEVVGDNPLDAATTDAALAPYLGDYADLTGLMAAVDALEQVLRDAGHAFHRVNIEPTPDGTPPTTVVLKVLTFGLGEVTVRGNQYSSEQAVRNSLPILASGAVPEPRELSRQLAVANQHPRRRVTVGYRQSREPDKLDAVANVTEQRPWGLFANLNNIGNDETGNSRLQFGGQYANITGHDDIATAAITLSPDNADDVFQFGAFYQLPIYRLRGWLNAFYVRSDVDVGAVQDAFDVSGAGHFTGLSFKHQLLNLGRYRHSATVGLQDRLFDTAISSTGTGVFNPGLSTKVRSRPLSIRYDGGYLWTRTRTSLDFYVDYNHNLDFGGHNHDRDYAGFRFASDDPPDSSWKLVRFGTLATQQLPRGYSGVLRLTGQYTSETLIPGEQIGLGGERSVRGFEERTIAGDSGLVANLELWTPALPRLYDIRLLGFLDAGHKVINSPGTGQLPHDTISSIGVGARWAWRDQLQVSLDYGQPLANADGEASDRGNSKWHVSLTYRY
ncbi:MAG: ShlB/FhaC/HecB family hemolysin secretion/activation protein [Gammaproteobacteria bacterium]|nr:ShlB/FhaC/HecB family hemolysin secretion/activation protein [Gammaproteobacteria bacterium]